MIMKQNHEKVVTNLKKRDVERAELISNKDSKLTTLIKMQKIQIL